MTTINPTVLADIERAKQGPALEDDLRESVRAVVADIDRAKRGSGDLRNDSVDHRGATLRPGDSESEAAVNSLEGMVQRVGRLPLEQIDRLIGELHSLGELLEAEGQHVQREIARYAQLSQASMQSTKIMAETLAQWRSVAPRRVG
jgi:hypothetical protein